MPLGSNEGLEENSVVLGSSEGMGLVAREGKALGIISEFAVGSNVDGIVGPGVGPGVGCE